jgi:hypothetical protein
LQDLTLEQINLPNTASSGSLILSTQTDSNGSNDNLLPDAQNTQNNMNNSNITTPTQLGLDQGAMHEVYVSAIVAVGIRGLQKL